MVHTLIDWLRNAGGAGQRAEDQAPEIAPAIALDGRELPVAIRRHPRATRLTMRLAPDGSELRVTMPRWGRTADALDFAHSRLAWIETQLAAVPRPRPPEAGGTIAYRGERLLIAWQEELPRRPLLDAGELRLGGPQATLVQRLRRWLEGSALELMQQDLGFYCQRAGVALPDLRLSRATRRWGSCSPAGRIRINWRLVQAPDAVRRSVVAHEVAHLTHFDHSPAFHAQLARIYDGNLAQADGWLRREGRGLYAAFG